MNRDAFEKTGAQLEVACAPATTFYDLYRGVALDFVCGVPRNPESTHQPGFFCMSAGKPDFGCPGERSRWLGRSVLRDRTGAFHRPSTTLSPPSPPSHRPSVAVLQAGIGAVLASSTGEAPPDALMELMAGLSENPLAESVPFLDFPLPFLDLPLHFLDFPTAFP